MFSELIRGLTLVYPLEASRTWTMHGEGLRNSLEVMELYTSTF